jgi:hypothetical protein
VRRFWRSTRPEIDRIEILSAQLERNARWIDAADAKAGAVLVFVTAVVGLLLAPLVAGVEIALGSAPPKDTFSLHIIATVYVAATGIAFFAALNSLLESFRALLPQVKRTGTRGDVFFGDIAHRSLREWERQVESLTAPSLILDLTEQVHRTARIANFKHHRARSAIHGAAWTVGFGLLAYLLNAWVT